MAGIGKRIRGALYVHRSALKSLGDDRRARVEEAERLAGDSEWNVARFDPGGIVGLLHYADFEADAFPRLEAATRVDPDSGKVSRTCYAGGTNPLILHRKELLLAPGDPRVAEWAALTRELVALGLFSNPVNIGRKQAWEERLAKAGRDGQGKLL